MVLSVLLLAPCLALAQAVPALRPGPEPQFLPVEREAESKPPVSGFSNGGRRIVPCPGTKNVFSFDCYIDAHRKAVAGK